MSMLDNIQEKMNVSRKFLIIASTICIIVVILIIVAVCVIQQKDTIDSRLYYSKKVSLDANNDLKDKLPDKTIDIVSSEMYHLLAKNFNVNEDSSSTLANIREDSYQWESQDDVNSVKFIVDIDKYQQTYQVSIAWSDNELMPDGVIIECARRDQSKFPDIKCHGMYYDSNSLELYLPYDDVLSSGVQYSASLGDLDNSGFQHINVTVQDCGDSNVKEEAVDAVKKYLKSTAGLDPEQYIYQRTSDYSNCN